MKFYIYKFVQLLWNIIISLTEYFNALQHERKGVSSYIKLSDRKVLLTCFYLSVLNKKHTQFTLNIICIYIAALNLWVIRNSIREYPIWIPKPLALWTKRGWRRKDRILGYEARWPMLELLSCPIFRVTLLHTNMKFTGIRTSNESQWLQNNKTFPA